MKPGDLLVCALISPLKTGAQFKEWPLHVTLVPWFRNGLATNEIASRLGQELRTLSSFKVVMGESRRFGHNKDKDASLVELPSPLMDIEQSVRHVLKGVDSWLVDETTRVRRAYVPHVAAQKSARMRAGDECLCDRLYIVEQLGGMKRIDEVIFIGNEQETA